MTQYAIRRDTLWKGPLLLIGATASRAFVELDDEALTVRFGLAEERIPLAVVRSADPKRWPILYGIGIRIGPGGIAYVGSRFGVVHVTFSEEQRFQVFFGWRSRFDGVYVSLEEPEAFLADLRSRIA